MNMIRMQLHKPARKIRKNKEKIQDIISALFRVFSVKILADYGTITDGIITDGRE